MAALISCAPGPLEFPGDDGQACSTQLQIKNETDGQVAFKVKTTAPRAYLVRPSSGILQPNAWATVQVVLQASASRDQTHNHRFLVQAVKTQEEQQLSREDWAAADKSAIQEIRLAVSFGESTGAGAAPGTGSGAAAPSGDSSEFRSKYDELVRYCLKMETEKKDLERKLTVVEQKASGGGRGATAPTGFSAVHLIVAMVISALAMYMAPAFVGQQR